MLQTPQGKQAMCDIVLPDVARQMNDGATMLLSDTSFLQQASSMLTKTELKQLKEALEKLPRSEMVLPFGAEPGQRDPSEPVGLRAPAAPRVMGACVGAN